LPKKKKTSLWPTCSSFTLRKRQKVKPSVVAVVSIGFFNNLYTHLFEHSVDVVQRLYPICLWQPVQFTIQKIVERLK
jgi:hypothetical protein